jgi:hypothetical protein
VTQNPRQGVDRIVRLELSESPRCNSADARRIVLSYDANERRYCARRLHPTNGGHGGLANLLGIVAEQTDKGI